MGISIQRCLVAVFALGLLGCGGGGSASNTSGNSSSLTGAVVSSSSSAESAALSSTSAALSSANSSSSPAIIIAKVEIEQTGLLLTQVSATKQLSVSITDALGNKITQPITWISSNPATVSVSDSGMVTALLNNGASQIIAEVGGIKSASLLVVITEPVANAILLNDAQIVGEPQETSPAAEPDLLNTYFVGLSGVTAPATGSILINTESKKVAGRVVAVDTNSVPMKVTLELVSLREMFPHLNLNEVIDLSNAEITHSANVTALYEIERNGNSFSYTPKASPLMATSRMQKASAKQLGPFSCERFTLGEDDTDAPVEIELQSLPNFTVALNPSLDIIYTSDNGLERLVMVGKPETSVDVGIQSALAFEGKVECKAELFKLVIPIGGALAWVIGGSVPVGVGFEAGGKLTLAEFKFGAKVVVTADARAGISCPLGQSCAFERAFENFSTSMTPRFDLPSLDGVKFESAFSGFGYAELELGSPIFESLQFSLVEVKAGAKFEANFASMEDQLADANYASNYGAKLAAGFDIGKHANRALELLGVPHFTDQGFEVDTSIAQSPVGAATGAISADVDTFEEGDLVNFTVKLDTLKANFFPGIGPYNVKKIQLVRKVGSTISVVAEQNAGGDGHNFVFGFPYTATDSGKTEEFSAFVVTNLVPFDVLALELGTVPAALTTTPGSGLIHINYLSSQTLTYTSGATSVCCDEGSGSNILSSLLQYDFTYTIKSLDAQGAQWEVLSAPGNITFNSSEHVNHRDVFREDMSMNVYRLFDSRSGIEKKNCTVTEMQSRTRAAGGAIEDDSQSPIVLEMASGNYTISMYERSFGSTRATTTRTYQRTVAGCDVIKPDSFASTGTEPLGGFSTPVFTGTIDPATPGVLRGSQTINDGDSAYTATWEIQLPKSQ